MRKGEIIRRVMQDGTKIGPYKIITGGVGSIVYCTFLHNGKPTSALKKTHSVCKLSKVEVTTSIYNRIVEGLMHSVIHDDSKVWRRIINNEAELIQFRDTRSRTNYAIFKIDRITELYVDRKKCIRVWLDERIL